MKRQGLTAIGAVLMLAGAMIGCGGGGAAGSCAKVQPCGGNVAGTWAASAACESANSQVDSDFCPTSTSTSSLSLSGDVTFGADGTFTTNITVNGTVSVTTPSSCLTTQGVTITCNQLDQELQSQIAAGQDAGLAKASCRTGGGGCICDLTLDSASMSTSGTYTSNGNQLDLSNGDGGPYCVQGNELHLLTLGTTVNMGQTMGSMTIQSDFVFVKK